MGLCLTMPPAGVRITGPRGQTFRIPRSHVPREIGASIAIRDPLAPSTIVGALTRIASSQRGGVGALISLPRDWTIERLDADGRPVPRLRRGRQKGAA